MTIFRGVLENNREHKVAAGWSLGIVVAVLTILSLLGVLPWATRAEVKEVKSEAVEQLKKIDARFDKVEQRFDAHAERVDRKLDEQMEKLLTVVRPRNP
mgnify:FL=1